MVQDMPLLGYSVRVDLLKGSQLSCYEDFYSHLQNIRR
jgi:hypothetical protein